MSRRRTFQIVIGVMAIAVAADLLTERLARNSVPRQTMARIDSAPKTIDVLGIGNSLISTGFDPAVVEQTFQQAGRSCTAVNGALGATGALEHLALARMAFRSHTVKILVYGFADQKLSSDVVKKNSDLIGNRAMLYYADPQLTLQYARFDPLNRLYFQFYRRFALLRERGSIWAGADKLRGAADPFEGLDLALQEPSESQSFLAACQAVVQSGGALSAPVQALLQQAREQGAKVVVVEMPMHPSHVKKFYTQPIWQKFRAATRIAVEDAGATYLNASGWLPDGALFPDHLHFSKEGAHEFSRLLARYLMEQGL